MLKLRNFTLLANSNCELNRQIKRLIKDVQRKRLE